MPALLGTLLPLAVGVAVTPLVVVAIIVTLLSRRPLVNGLAFLTGWVVGIVIGVTVAYVVTGALRVHEQRESPLWLAVLRITVGAVLLGGAWYVWRRGRSHVRAMAAARNPSDVVAAAPQLPGWLHAVESFTPARSALVATALCLVNPVDLSFLVVAGLDLRLADESSAVTLAAGAVFVLVAASTVAVPVLLYATRRAQAEPVLRRMRDWLAGNTGLLDIAVLVFIGAMQLIKGVRAL